MKRPTIQEIMDQAKKVFPNKKLSIGHGYIGLYPIDPFFNRSHYIMSNGKILLHSQSFNAFVKELFNKGKS